MCQDLKAQLQKRIIPTSDNSDNEEQTEVQLGTYEKPDWKTIDINFLNSYYSQDGMNSPVTGGIGTELLTDFTQKITVSIPLNPKLKLNVDGGYDYYRQC